MTALAFKQLNKGWNASPNGSTSVVDTSDDTLTLRFDLNPFAFDDVEEGETGLLIFAQCSRWRLGPTNDEGWFRGQCRYSGEAPSWGKFYELVGDDPKRDDPTDWRETGAANLNLRHFLFYLKDETFECLAGNWNFSKGQRWVIGVAPIVSH